MSTTFLRDINTLRGEEPDLHIFGKFIECDRENPLSVTREYNGQERKLRGWEKSIEAELAEI